LLVAGHAPPPTRITATASRLILRIGISSPILTAGIKPRRITCEASFLRRLGAPTSRGRLPICCSCPKAKSPLEITMAVGHSVGYPSRRKTIRAPGFPRPGALSRLWPWPSSSSSVLTAQQQIIGAIDRASTGHDQPSYRSSRSKRRGSAGRGECSREVPPPGSYVSLGCHVLVPKKPQILAWRQAIPALPGRRLRDEGRELRLDKAEGF